MIKKLKDHGIRLYYIDLNKDGYYAPNLRTMFINQNLTDAETKKVILHELKHALDHHEYSILYKSIHYRMKMEKEANDYMLLETIANNDGYYDATLVMQEFGLGLGNHFEK